MALVSPPPPAGSTLGFPTILVEIQFTAGVWTDVTAWVRQDKGITWGTRGRADEFAESQPNTLSLTLDNTDGRFTAGRTGSPYYPNVKMGKLLRFSVTYNAVLYRRFVGQITGWPTEWPGGSSAYSLVQITAVDMFRKLGRARPLRSMLQEEVLYDGPVAYWPLGEPAGSLTAADVSGVQTNLKVTQAGTGGTITFASGIGPPSDGLAAVMAAPVDEANGLYLLAGPIPGAVVGGVCTVEGWFVGPSLAGYVGTVCGVVFDDKLSYLQVHLQADGTLRLIGVVYNAVLTSFFANVSTSTSKADGSLHHFVAVMTTTTSLVKVTLYVDGVLVATASTTVTGTGNVPVSISALAVGAFPTRYGISEAQGVWKGTLAHFAVYGKAVTVAQQFAHYTAGKVAFAGELSNLRIARLARYAGVAVADTALDTGASAICAQSVENSAPLALMQEVTKAEDGALYVAGNGKLTFQSRTRRVNLTSSFTLSVGSVQVGEDIKFVRDDTYVFNDVTYDRPKGAPQRAINTAPMGGDVYADTGTLVLMTDNEVLDRANWRVNVYPSDKDRCPQVTVDLLTEPSATLVSSVLYAEPSTMLTLSSLPATGPASSVDLIVEGVSEVLSTTEWKVVFNTAPPSGLIVWRFNSVATFPLTFGM